jgi:hypothetical protein
MCDLSDVINKVPHKWYLSDWNLKSNLLVKFEVHNDSLKVLSILFNFYDE